MQHRGQRQHRLHSREILAAFDGADPAADLQSFEEDLLIADLDIVTGRVERRGKAALQDDEAARYATIDRSVQLKLGVVERDPREVDPLADT